ncbi:hypothetical protein LL50_05310 [Listeria monocytogenes]|nr:hypothetical protein [Listeria monocytogenes]EAD0383126.1 hypothetical protein [Listeria monocytogenes]EAD9126948.1 hypothetical protein [Listeria monocytogenes]EAE9168072.1 hypothetical protein [Listeria monocytogenes]EAF2023468.1 hypothetical protein [Listeria monocytogenes]
MAIVGKDAISALRGATQESSSGGRSTFTSLKSGTKLLVKALPLENIAAYDSYGIFKKVNSFEAEKPSIKNVKGFATEELTPWDLASKYYQDQVNELIENGKNKEDADVKPLRVKASDYRSKRKYIVPFINLESGEVIYIDFTKNQAESVISVIENYEEKGRLDTTPFELSKTGQKTETKVSLMPAFKEDLNETAIVNFDEVSAENVNVNFDGLTFIANEKTQIESLVASGFDVSLLDIEVPETDPTEAF